MSPAEFPLSPRDDLIQSYQGQSLHDVPVPAAVIDVAKVKANCQAMLDAVEQLDVSFRAHVKTHKTLEITRLQVGNECKDVRLIVSTVIEAEQLVPLLSDYKQRNAKVNVLYGVPLGPSHVHRLAAVGRELGDGSITTMIDNPGQLESLKAFRQIAGFAASVFIKTDSGYHRAGLGPGSPEMKALIEQIAGAEEEGYLRLFGFYSHNSLSYGGSSPDHAMDMLKTEIDVCREASRHFKSKHQSPLVVSVGASPTALSLQNLLPSISSSTSSATALKDTLELTRSNLELEIHAGVYPIFDIQQVAASSRHLSSDPHDLIAASVIAEVCSIYPTRTEQPEALISAGGLALAREPCKDYPGWAVVSPWNMPKGYQIGKGDRIIVSRISQEHGILGFENKQSDRELPLTYGQKLRLWPNHACITLAMFGWYLVVDSSTQTPNKIVDVWVRWRGW
ncbi:putative serine dehydratase domain-containing protein [Exophiala viscosa]|uniref:D-serine dehydratase n=1 Tax=Exophiala viscosa TaxID=2486360 RepID=A0AAN6DSW4_9EURO|nr:putative serine dehydratase domain-containing protein [Exophiala viscosa]KAI1623656.1 putative serine dehydratase domain-containing protein [Exophiala viscosa]